jgi:hypothetical protein
MNDERATVDNASDTKAVRKPQGELEDTNPHKVEDLAKAGRKDFDSNEGDD